jgi:hypothetical protein
MGFERSGRSLKVKRTVPGRNKQVIDTFDG